MLMLAAEHDALSIVDDQVGTPTGADLLADVTAHVIRAVRQAPRLGGTYHVVAAGETTWYGYAGLVFDYARAHGLPMKASAEGVKPVPTSAYPTAARRPLNSRLATGKLRRSFGLSLPPWQSGVERMLDEACAK
jgi:dTDP-4-dehydrorhamnose reductase